MQTTGTPLFTGTFAARVYLSDKPVSGRNGDYVVQTFFPISGKYVPREKVDMHFSNWFIDLPFTGGSRTWNMKVNCFYYKADEAVCQADAQKTVDGFYGAGTDHINTVPKS